LVNVVDAASAATASGVSSLLWDKTSETRLERYGEVAMVMGMRGVDGRFLGWDFSMKGIWIQSGV
jgi:hypothetical protein